MLFNLNEFLMAVSFALDYVEMDILGVTTNHSKRTAYISLRVAEELGFNTEKLHDIVALAMLHDNGVCEKSLHDKLNPGDPASVNLLERIKEHCTIGEENIREYPFLTDVRNVIKYHHEKYDGTGFFNISGEDIPLMSQIICMADVIELNFDLQNNNFDLQNRIAAFLRDQENRMFSERIVKAFISTARNKAFWMDLRSGSVSTALKKGAPKYSLDLPFSSIHRITQVLSRIIDSKSKFTRRHSMSLSERTAAMADYYGIKGDDKMKLRIAADLHDIGKLAVPNSILDSPEKLTQNEFEAIKEHPYYTRLALQEIKGFEDITEWASNHHEKLNGLGYPYGKSAADIDFNSRIIACLDIYEALIEDRPYRGGLTHEEASEILAGMKREGFIDAKITDDIIKVFGREIEDKP